MIINKTCPQISYGAALDSYVNNEANKQHM